jgi:hypothetical protein
MADDDLIDDDLDDLDDTMDVEDLDAEDLDESVLEDEELEEEELVLEDEDTDVAVVEEPPRARKKRDEEEDDEEELDPDDVEADLDTILKDRIAASEDEDEDEDLEEQEPRATGEAVDGVQPKKANEFTCTGCFLLVHPGQFGPPDHLECPVGESVCPAIEVLERQYAKARK